MMPLAKKKIKLLQQTFSSQFQANSYYYSIIGKRVVVSARDNREILVSWCCCSNKSTADYIAY